MTAKIISIFEFVPREAYRAKPTEPAVVIILPVIRIDRGPDGSNDLEPHNGAAPGRRRRRPASRTD